MIAFHVVPGTGTVTGLTEKAILIQANVTFNQSIVPGSCVDGSRSSEYMLTSCRSDCPTSLQLKQAL